MRKMSNGISEIEIIEFIITKNFWEYYVINEDTGNDDIKTCLVTGFETEIGDVYMPEIDEYILTRSKNLNEVMPAKGWEWV